jgi:hypothetical protein
MNFLLHLYLRITQAPAPSQPVTSWIQFDSEDEDDDEEEEQVSNEEQEWEATAAGISTEYQDFEEEEEEEESSSDDGDDEPLRLNLLPAKIETKNVKAKNISQMSKKERKELKQKVRNSSRKHDIKKIYNNF